ncbi:MAG: hypothetical protein A3G97_16040 [Candidatus Rokubacteria bacterium RIFCSPLOWO2_12_FULL_69_21]|nr:MAG: hypothetical protein A3G97_16040 [Candidatus Rokubacteria bacterium RIFCSPLOWO2_12_FULL_69_21]
MAFSSGTPRMLALDQESRWNRPVEIESGTLETTAFQVAEEVETLSMSQRRWAAPSMVLPGPSGSWFGLRYWRVSRMNTSSSFPQRTLR